MEEILELNLLGRPQFHLGGDPVTGFTSVKPQALLSYLAVTGEPHNRPALAGLLWGSMPETNARMNLSQALSMLRRFFVDYLTIERQAVGIKHDPQIWIDVEHFKSQFSGFPSTIDIPSLEEAEQTYRGDFMEGFDVRNAPEFELWQLTVRRQLREQIQAALQHLADYHLESGQTGWDKAIDYTRRLLTLEPCQENAHRTMMRLLALTGRRTSALLQYEQCQQNLRDGLGIEPGPVTIALYNQIRSRNFPPPEEYISHPVIKEEKSNHGVSTLDSGIVPERYPTNLTAQTTKLIGRESELEALGELLIGRGNRLVTLVGPGGIGKTRLALEFATRQLVLPIPENPDRVPQTNLFPDGVYFVPLESLDSHEMIWAAISQALRFKSDQGEGQLLHYLRTKKLLIVIDNFEHLLDGAETLSLLLESAPDVYILATSREPLSLIEEQVIPLDGLEFPEPVQETDAIDYAAGKLFIQTARRQRPDFSLKVSDKDALAAICQQVEGMPLALELAASWTDSLSLSDIIAEISTNFDFLTAKYRNMPPRHQNLRAVFDGTWDRLSEDEKSLFANLSIFRGGFTRESASRVTGATAQDIGSLVRRSLLRFNKPQGRYSIHELLRQYGEEKLKEPGESQLPLRDHHSQYYCKWIAERITPGRLKAEGQWNVLEAVSAELENIKSAWNFALGNKSFRRILGGVDGFGLFYAWRGGFKEGDRFFCSLADQLGDTNLEQEPERIFLTCQILNWQAYFLYELGDRPGAIDLLLLSWELINSTGIEEIDTRAARANNLAIRTLAGWWQTTAERLELIQQARALYREVDHPFGLPFVLSTSANLALVTGQLADARRYYEESQELYERTGNLLGKAAAMSGLGSLAFALNDYITAEKVLLEAITIAGGMQDLFRVASALLSLGCVYLYWGKFQHARSILQSCVDDFKNMRLKNYHAASLYYVGFACLHLGEYKQATDYGIAALPLAQETDYKEIIAQSMMLPAAVALAGDEYSEAIRGFKEANRVFVEKRYTRILFGDDPGRLGHGAALLGLGELQHARSVFSDQLQQAYTAHRQESLLYALAGLALLQAKQGRAVYAIELYSLADSFPFIGDSHWFADAFERHIESASAELAEVDIKAARDHGKRQDLWGTAEQLIASFSTKNIDQFLSTSS